MITKFSFFMAIFWFSIWGCFLAALHRRKVPVFRYGLAPAVCFLILGLVRMLVSIELPHAPVLGSRRILVWGQQFLSYPLARLPFSPSVGQVLLLLWLAVAVGRILLFWLRWAWEMRKLNRAPRVSEDWAQQAAQKAAGRPLDLVLSPETTTPYVVGFFRPTVVLPGLQYTPDQLELALRHEWQHFLNKDQWKKTLARMLELILWWNPAGFLARKVLERILEVNCDFKALKKLPKSRHEDYFQAILTICRRVNEQKNFPDGAAFGMGLGSKEALKERILVGMALQKPMSRRDRRVSAALCAAAAAVFLFSYSFLIQPQSPAPAIDEDGYWTCSDSDYPANSILLHRRDGLYEMYVDGSSWGTLMDPTWGPHASMPIIPEEVWKWGVMS